MQIPVTYYPVPTQRQLQINRARIADKPYAKYFNSDLWIHDDVLPALSAPMDPALVLAREDVDRLLDDSDLPGETGYCALPDGTAYVASRVPFRGVSLDAFRWWWWWHSEESARYTLWYPHNHVSAERTDREAFTTPGLTDEQRYIGSTHAITEYIGPNRVEILIRFVDPSEMGLDAERLRRNGVVHGCGWVWLRKPRVRIVRMVHLARPTPDGFELRSRYWIGADLRVKTPIGEMALPRGLRRRLTGDQDRMAALAYEQLLHDQIEFTHLSTFLAPLYAEFGRR